MGLFSRPSILDIKGSDARYVLQSALFYRIFTVDTNTINSVNTINSSQDAKTDTNAPSVAGTIILAILQLYMGISIRLAYITLSSILIEKVECG